MEILRDAAASDAGADDYNVESIVIEAGETTGTTTLMVVGDDLPDGGAGANQAEALVPFGSVDGVGDHVEAWLVELGCPDSNSGLRSGPSSGAAVTLRQPFLEGKYGQVACVSWPVTHGIRTLGLFVPSVLPAVPYEHPDPAVVFVRHAECGV